MKKPVTLAAIALCIVAAVVVIFVELPGNASSNSSPQDIASLEAQGYQVASIDVTDDGFDTNHIELKAGVPAKINFKKETGFTCIKSVQSKDLDFDIYLNKGNNFVTLEDLKPGTYKFNCGMYMYYGTITVQ